MNALETRFGFAPLFVALLLALAAVVGWETGWGRRVMRTPEFAPVAAPQPVALSLLPDYGIEGGVEARRETVDRPAFVPTRRPAPPPPQEVVKTRMQKGQFLLTGTAVVDKNAVAFLREVSGGKARSVRAGESINGLTVAEIKQDRIKFTLGDDFEELVLKVAAGPRQTIQPPQPGAAAAAGPATRSGTPAGQPVAGAPAPMDSDAQILERRAAARAQLAAETAARAATGEQPPRPVSPTAVLQPAPGGAPAASGNQPDPAWQDVYRRMQQPRR